MKHERFDLLVRGGTLVSGAGRTRGDVGIRGDRIAAVGDLGGAEAEQVIEAQGLHVLPGVIDTQVHFREPGFPEKEDLESGTRAAVAGGVTAICEMPNTKPPTTTAEALNAKVEGARGRAWCDHAFFVGAADDNLDRLGELERLPGCAGVKIFMGSSTGTLLVSEDASILTALRSGRRRVAVHCEDEKRLVEREPLRRGAAGVQLHPVWRDAEAALIATRRLTALARQAGRKVHVLHVSTRDEIAFLRGKKDDLITVETTPQHLTLAAPECYERLGTFAQMNPPVRDAAHREGIWEGVLDGTVDVIGSDHAPHTIAEKQRGYPDTPSGMTGVQTLLPVMLDHVASGRLTLERLVQLVCENPVSIYGMKDRGRIAAGKLAGLTLVDLKRRRTIENAWIESTCGWTPFDGVTVTGWPEATIVGGKIAMREGELVGRGLGRPIAYEA